MLEFRGTYGKVIMSSGGRHVKKYVNKYSVEKLTDGTEEWFYESTTIREMMILFSLPIIPNLIFSESMTNHHEIFSIKMPYKGITLDKWCYKHSFLTRIKHIPSFIFQLLNVLKFLEDIKVVHGDIKPTNILVDTDNTITLIDFGACIVDTTIISAVSDSSIFNMCTYSFSSPEMLSLSYKKNTINNKHDIFSVGMVVKFMIINNYSKDDITNISECEKNNKEFLPLNNITGIPEDIKNIVNEMLIIDLTKRPSALDLLSRKMFEDMKQPIHPPITNIFNSTISSVITPQSIRRKTIEWIFNTCNYPFIATLAVWILDKFSYQYIIYEQEYTLIASACIIISDGMLQWGSTSLNYLSLLTGYSIRHISKIVCTILKELKYIVYARTFDYYLRCRNIEVDYNIVRDILIDNISLPVEKQIEIYIQKTQDEINIDISNLKISE